MSDDARPTFLARLARRPAPIFLGLVVGFLGCCVAGRVAARQQPYKNFVRFHPGLAPDSHYYPTYSQTLNLARQKVKPGTTLVLIGGNSILQGVGQRAAHIWSAHLQRVLGDEFVVLNLAMRGQWPNEVGQLVAERLAADGVPVLFVTVGVESASWGSDWDGGVYRTFFWDAWGKGLVPSDPRRDKWLEDGFEVRYSKAPRVLEKLRENRRRGLVDGATYSQDLWNYVADRYLGTVWTPLKYPKFWRPHRELIDTDPGATVPFEAMNNEKSVPFELAHMRALSQSPFATALLRGEGYEAVADQYGAQLPDVLRDRTLYVLRTEGTYYRALLTPEERANYEEFYRRLGHAVRSGGLNAVVVGEKYEERDYFDRSHFSEQGGKKLAEELTPLLRAMNERLYPKPAPGGTQP